MLRQWIENPDLEPKMEQLIQQLRKYDFEDVAGAFVMVCKNGFI
jgi:hypothetical protein